MKAGARIAPTFVPELKIPVTSARSRCGNHSAVVLMAAGKLPDSPSPRKKRATPKPSADAARALRRRMGNRQRCTHSVLRCNRWSAAEWEQAGQGPGDPDN